MNARIRTLVAAAEAELSATEQERLADVVQAFLDACSADGDFPEAEMAHLRMVHQEPFEAADPKAVAVYLGGRA